MAEKLTLAAPQTFPSILDFSVERMDLNRRDSRIHIEVISNTGVRKEHDYVGADAMTKMIALNKANLSIKSLERRIIEQLQADGVLPAGTISGTPD